MRRTTAYTWPFTYETDASVIVEMIEVYDRMLGIERRCVARWLKSGFFAYAQPHRREIVRIEAARRAGLTRLRALGRPVSGSPVLARAA